MVTDSFVDGDDRVVAGVGFTATDPLSVGVNAANTRLPNSPLNPTSSHPTTASATQPLAGPLIFCPTSQRNSFAPASIAAKPMTVSDNKSNRWAISPGPNWHA